MRDQVTRIVASCEPRGLCEKMKRLLEVARKDGAEALALLGDLGADGEAREYARLLRTVGRADLPTYYVPGPDDAPFGKYLRGRITRRWSLHPCTEYMAPLPSRLGTCSSPEWEAG